MAERTNILVADFGNGQDIQRVVNAFQYDRGMVLELRGIGNEAIPEVQFAYEGMEAAIGVVPQIVGEVMRVQIPDAVLLQEKPINAYLYVERENEDMGFTQRYVTIYIIPRTRPSKFEITPTQQESWNALVSELNQLLEAVGNTPGLQFKGVFPTYEALIAAHPTGNSGDMYIVGDSVNNYLYVWDDTNNVWFNTGRLKGEQGIQGPQGERGPNNIYVGPTAPTNNEILVWIDSSESTTDGVLKVRETGTSNWIGISSIQGERGPTGEIGPIGPAGPNIEFRISPDNQWLQWSVAGTTTWYDLVSIDEFTRRFEVLGIYSTYEDLITDHPTGTVGESYLVGDPASNTVYVWDVPTNTWKNAGPIAGPAGRGITQIVITNGELIITFTDGATLNAGNIQGPIGPIGPIGPDGDAVELRTTTTYLQWKGVRESTESWKNLVALDDIKGTPFTFNDLTEEQKDELCRFTDADRNTLTSLAGLVNQDVRSNASPTFTNLTITGTINAARVVGAVYN